VSVSECESHCGGETHLEYSDVIEFGPMGEQRIDQLTTFYYGARYSTRDGRELSLVAYAGKENDPVQKNSPGVMMFYNAHPKWNIASVLSCVTMER